MDTFRLSIFWFPFWIFPGKIHSEYYQKLSYRSEDLCMKTFQFQTSFFCTSKVTRSLYGYRYYLLVQKYWSLQAKINHPEICRFPLRDILSFFDVWFSCQSFQIYLEMNTHDHHTSTLEHVREQDSESYSRNANKTFILEGCIYTLTS